MTSLITRLEALAGPDRELGNEILLECGWSQREDGDGPDRITIWIAPDGGEFFDGEQLNPTRSIDAARSICKDAMVVQASEIGADGLPMVWLVTDTSTSPVIDYIGIASTIELAWCIAALKAREAINEN